MFDKDEPNRQVLDTGRTGVLILPLTLERFELGEWRLVRKELIGDSNDVYMPHVELKVGVEGSWNTDKVVQQYMHRPWYLIDNRLQLELHNIYHRWNLEVEPWDSQCYQLEPECSTGRVYPEAMGSACHRFYVHDVQKFEKELG
jgi:hypothetical protein